MRDSRKGRGRPAQRRIQRETAEKLRRLLGEMGLTLCEVARNLGKRERWLEDAFARRDRKTGERLALLESDAIQVLGMLRKLDWRRYRGLFHAFAEIDSEVRHQAFQRSEHLRANDPIPLLLMDNAVDQFADTFIRYLQDRGVDAPRRKVVVEFFMRVPHPNGQQRFNYLELCAAWFEIKANDRAKKIRITPSRLKSMTNMSGLSESPR